MNASRGAVPRSGRQASRPRRGPRPCRALRHRQGRLACLPLLGSAPRDAFIMRLDDLSTGFCAGGNFPPARAPPDVFFDYLERYLYIHKVHSWGVRLFWPSCYPNWGQGKTFRSESTGKPENFPFPVHPRKGFPVIFRYFSFQILKIQKYL